MALRFLFKRYIQENFVYKECFEWKMKSEMKPNSKYLFELATLERNAIWRIQHLPQYANSKSSTLVQ